MLFALWRGDRPARLAALVYLCVYPALFIAQEGLDWGTAARLPVEAAGFVALLLLLLRDRPAWLLWAWAFRLIVVATYVATLLDPRISPLAFLTALNTWCVAELTALLWGAIQAARTGAARAIA
ncbi:hypothetical protein [Caulobacter sp. 17J65-9]|uniref:hypothetical protein n=1 Tax=Caulobacter sp. 17J65-9 TaxID=2709382 RepID=UPI0013CB1961|nr:hypothetical protein [Caulobacter sp. 17J65-9]NEX93623.1 hypothetical protein [Caulobacter sp. 17J65-9]